MAVNLVKKIPLTQGKVALVDDMDSEWLNQWKWRTHKQDNNFYFYGSGYDLKNTRSTYKIHRVIMERILEENGEFLLLKLFKENPRKYPIDHIDGDGLHNCRSNLRIVTPRQNQHNRHDQRSSNYPGVCFHKTFQKWMVDITVNKKKIHLGYFDNELEAVEAYEWAYKEVKRGNKIIPLSELYYLDNLKGVNWHKKAKKWQASVRLNGKQKYLGLFKDKEKARIAIEKAGRDFNALH